MIDHFKAEYCIDDSRIYAAGKSNGGGLTGLLACDRELSRQIAAFAPVSGAFYTGDSEDTCTGTFPDTVKIKCNPGRKPIPILEFHGDADEKIPYVGGKRNGGCLPTIPHWLQEWSRRDGFSVKNKTEILHGGNVTRYEFGGAEGNLGIVTNYVTKGLKHAWPSTEPNAYVSP
jgi:poly(3-hydroxybutyrate) depolymerase